MAKNTGASKFRKVDVDQYDEEIYKDDTDPQGDGDIEGDRGPSESEVNTFLAQGKNAEALGVILKNPPVGAKNQAVKDRAVQLAVRVLTTFKSNEIDPALKPLDSESLDTLMKYIYRGFEFPSENSGAALLTWHEKTFAVGGLGTIVRVLTDRKRV